jgi:hypothetical protein
MRSQNASLQKASLMLKPRNPCPVCGVETALAEIVGLPRFRGQVRPWDQGI